jgi:hypothetical protein
MTIKEVVTKNESILILTVLLAIVQMCSGCSDVQRVCPTGPETVYMAIAVEYWASQGEPIIMATDSECTIRTRVAEPPIPGEQWNGEIAMHKVYDLGVTELEPSHMVQTEIRIRESMWEQMPHLQRIYVAAHELAHAWYRGHSDLMPMRESNQTATEIKKWLTESGLEQYIQEENLP